VIEPPYATFVLSEIKALRAAGVRVTVFNSFRPFEQFEPEAEEERRGSHYFPPRYRGTVAANLRAAVGHPARYARAAADVARHGLPWRLLVLSAQYAAVVEATGVEHVHGMYGTTPASIALLTAALAGRPFSFTCHAYDIYRPNPQLRWKLARARFVTTISRFNKQYMADHYGAAPDKVHVVHLGVDDALWLPRPERAATDVTRIVCVASFIPCKGHAVLLEACALLQPRGRFHLTLVGGGQERDALRAQAERLGLGPQVTFAGALNQRDIAGLLRTADVFALPCIVDDHGYHDGLPVALMEAMASGVPTISTPVSGVPELITHGSSGLLVPQRDPAALAAAITEVSGTPALWEALSRGGRLRVEEIFNLRRNAREMSALFAESAERTPP
jgi:colanic acid/amylovoran biosynthesis glycosyltransferase